MTARGAWHRFFRWTQSWPVFLLIGCTFICTAVLQAWPAAAWLEVESVHVFDARAGEPIRMLVARRIHGPFVAAFSVRVHILRSGSSEVVCSVDARPGQYRQDATLPDPLTLSWWTHGQCQSLPAGIYTVTTTWTIDPPQPLVPAKTVTVTSNPFEVKP